MLFVAAVLAGCASQQRSGLEIVSREALPLDQAVFSLAVATLDGGRVPAGTRRALVIDPLIDRATGQETGATRSMVARIETLVRERYPQYELKPFTLSVLDEQPLILLGAITPAVSPGSLTSAREPTDTYRIWAVLADLRTGLILSHPTAWVQASTVDATPARFSSDSPVWVADAATAAYLRTCAGNPGDPIDPVYLRILRAQAAVAEATEAYEGGRYTRALTLYQTAAAIEGGRQLRVLNGIYLSNDALGRRDAAEASFGALVEYGLTQNRVAVKLLFEPGSTAFVRDAGLSRPYPMWLRQIAARTSGSPTCVAVIGHASVTGTPAANDAISAARATTVRGRLLSERPGLAPRTRAEGRGSREPIVGIGTDDLRDALDRRVEFNLVPCADTVAAATPPDRGG